MTKYTLNTPALPVAVANILIEVAIEILGEQRARDVLDHVLGADEETS